MFSVNNFDHYIELYKSKIIDKSTLNQFNEQILPKRFYIDKSKNIYLTQRELECIKTLLKNKSYKFVSNELVISHRTVQDHMNKIRDKLHVKNKKELFNIIENKLFKDIKNLFIDPKEAYCHDYNYVDE